MDRWIGRLLSGWMDGWTDEWMMDGPVGRWVGERLDVWMESSECQKEDSAGKKKKKKFGYPITFLLHVMPKHATRCQSNLRKPYQSSHWSHLFHLT